MRRPSTRSVLTLAVPLALLAGCSSASDEQSEVVTKAVMGDDWPLSVDEGTLRCEGSGGVGSVTIEVDGTTYAVNGTAKGGGENKDIESIWAAAETAGLKKDISPLIDKGLDLCK